VARSNFSITERLAIRARQIAYRSRNSSPYLSGDAFASLADIVISNEEQLGRYLDSSQDHRIIFCRSDYLSELKRITLVRGHKRILIAGNSDYDFTDINQLPQGLFQRFYLQNSFISNNKDIFTLPIGIENLSKGINGLPKNLTATLDWKEKSKQILVGPISPTHRDRMDLIAVAESQKGAFVLKKENISPSSFAKTMEKYRYIACPRGNGVDTHRFWETLYRGSIPIVLRNSWSQSLEYFKVPMIIINTWQEAEEAIEGFEQSVRMRNPRSLDVLWIDYWQKLFTSDL
jgi:hypothetical protein